MTNTEIYQKNYQRLKKYAGKIGIPASIDINDVLQDTFILAHESKRLNSLKEADQGEYLIQLFRSCLVKNKVLFGQTGEITKEEFKKFIIKPVEGKRIDWNRLKQYIINQFKKAGVLKEKYKRCIALYLEGYRRKDFLRIGLNGSEYSYFNSVIIPKIQKLVKKFMNDLKTYLESLKRYEEDVIQGIIFHIKNKNGEVKYLRLRPNGIDCIAPHGETFDQVKERFKHWNSEFLELQNFKIF